MSASATTKDDGVCSGEADRTRVVPLHSRRYCAVGARVMSVNVIVVGAGWRVRNDVLPALLAAGVNAEDIAVLRKKSEPVPGYPSVKVHTSTAELVPSQVTGSILISSVPTGEVFHALAAVLCIGTPASVLVDTPVSAIENDLRALEWVFQVRIGILEDSVLIPWLRNIRVKRPLVVWFIRSLYHYHGTAMLAQLTDLQLVRITPWFLMSSLPWVFVDSRFRFFIMSGPKNPARARGFIIAPTGKLIRESEFVATNVWEFLAQHGGLRVELLGVNFLDLQSHPLQSVDEWKRVGLMVGMRKLIYGKEAPFPTLEEAVNFEGLSAWNRIIGVQALVLRSVRRISDAIPGGGLVLRISIGLVRSLKRLGRRQKAALDNTS